MEALAKTRHNTVHTVLADDTRQVVLLYLTRSLLSRMDPGARLGLGGGARACRLDSFFGFLVLPGLVDLIRFAVFAKNRTSGRHRLSPPGFV